MSVFVSDRRRRRDWEVEVNYVRRSKNALGEEEFVPQQTEAVVVGGANFEKVRKGEAEERGEKEPLNRKERRIPPTILIRSLFAIQQF